MDPTGPVDRTFDKSRSNRRTERAGLDVLLRDLRFQAPGPGVRRVILRELDVEQFGTRAFDAVMFPDPSIPLDVASVPGRLGQLRLIEMKTTQADITNEGLAGFFFGATQREFELAERLGDRYLFAFVVLSRKNDYGAEFFVLLTFEELSRRIHRQRVQFQVDLKRTWDGKPSRFGRGPRA